MKDLEDFPNMRAGLSLKSSCGDRSGSKPNAKSHTLLILKSVKHTEICSQMQADTCI